MSLPYGQVAHDGQAAGQGEQPRAGGEVARPSFPSWAMLPASQVNQILGANFSVMKVRARAPRAGCAVQR